MTKFTLTYDDGSKKTVNRKPVHLMRTEQLGGKPGPNETVLISLWFADTLRPGFDRPHFENWVGDLDDWEIDMAEVESDPPGRTSGDSPD
jgi:hypothetical protein